TGANISVIQADTARDVGLSVHVVADRRTHIVDKVTSGDAALGALRLGRIHFQAAPHNWPGSRVLRPCVVGPARVPGCPGGRRCRRAARGRGAGGRWRPACPAGGAPGARVERAGSDARLVFPFEVAPPHPVTMLLGCREADPVGSHLPTVSERITTGRFTTSR